MTKARPWWHKDRHADRRPMLLARARIAKAIRTWLDGEGFVEVDPAILGVSPGNEAHLHAFSADLEATDGTRLRALHLHTSPEFACKKLLAAGEERLFALGHVFRNRERTVLHHPEFTMLEWYRAHAGYEATMADCAAFLRIAAEVTGRRVWSLRGVEVDATASPERVTLAQAFERFAGIDLLASCEPGGITHRDALADAARAAGIRVADDDTWADLFSRVLVERIEPHLGQGRPTILCEYPAAEAALARTKPEDPRVALRFELYAAGIELANGFDELTDADEQRRRFQAEMAEATRVYGRAYPLDEELLAALPAMPPTSGVALGFDRLVLLATGARSVEDVIWTPLPTQPEP